jgi:hypothetical protein
MPTGSESDCTANFPMTHVRRLAATILEIIAVHGEELLKLFVAVTPGGARISGMPGDDRR